MRLLSNGAREGQDQEVRKHCHVGVAGRSGTESCEIAPRMRNAIVVRCHRIDPASGVDAKPVSDRLQARGNRAALVAAYLPPGLVKQIQILVQAERQEAFWNFRL